MLVIRRKFYIFFAEMGMTLNMNNAFAMRPKNKM